jgi:hypothetical protein
MNPYDYYITPEEYDQAAANGIGARQLNRRIRDFGWSKQRAITESPREVLDRRELLRIAASNGVGRVTFQTRISRGWDAEKAAMTPPSSKAENAERFRRLADEKRIIPIDVKELAERNGISYKVLSWRILRAEWSHDRAATEPVWTPEQRARYASRRYQEIYGRKFNAYFRLADTSQ